MQCILLELAMFLIEVFKAHMLLQNKQIVWLMNIPQLFLHLGKKNKWISKNLSSTKWCIMEYEITVKKRKAQRVSNLLKVSKYCFVPQNLQYQSNQSTKPVIKTDREKVHSSMCVPVSVWNFHWGNQYPSCTIVSKFDVIEWYK